MSLHKHSLFDVDITVSSKKELLDYIDNFFTSNNPTIHQSTNQTLQHSNIPTFTIVTPNSEQIMLAKKDTTFKKILNNADIALPDGIGVVWAMKVLQNKSIHRISGIDFMVDLIAYAVKQKMNVAFLGGENGIAIKAFECQKKKFSLLGGFADEVGMIDYNRQNGVDNIINTTSNLALNTIQLEKQEQLFHDIAEKIISENIGMVFVGMGMGKQEWVTENIKCQISNIKSNPRSKIHTPIFFMSVGGAFDMLSGAIPRASVFVRSMGLEWLWRLIQEPWRWKRQVALIQFIWRVAQEKFH
jgi:N-acetylglucosaminyldiphosphoundecaprenol N-acetyl-beta-D-mannosaminyltransferase